MKKRRLCALGLAASLVATAPSAFAGAADEKTIDLSPANWSDREALEELNAFFETDKPLAEGEHGVISGTTGPQAVRAGLEALRQGGTAADAVIATALTQISLAGGAWVSYAGIFNLVYYEAESGEVFNVNGAYDTVRGETEPLTIPTSTTTGAEHQPSGRTALVPGFFGGLGVTHDRFGKLPWASLFEPAIHYAENGVLLGAIHTSMIEMRKEALSRLPATRRIFTDEDGDFLGEGDTLRQPELAATLRAVAEQGIDYVYRGPWAERLVEAVRRDGGKLSMEDMRSYEALVADPVHSTYNGFDVYGHGLPAQGGVHVAEVLNLAEAAGLRDMGHYAKSPEAFFWVNQMTNLMGIVFLPEPMRRALYGDLDATLAGRTGKENAEGLWARMQSGIAPLTKVPTPVDPKHSDAIVAIDAWGNVCRGRPHDQHRGLGRHGDLRRRHFDPRLGVLSAGADRRGRPRQAAAGPDRADDRPAQRQAGRRSRLHRLRPAPEDDQRPTEPPRLGDGHQGGDRRSLAPPAGLRAPGLSFHAGHRRRLLSRAARGRARARAQDRRGSGRHRVARAARLRRRRDDRRGRQAARRGDHPAQRSRSVPLSVPKHRLSNQRQPPPPDLSLTPSDPGGTSWTFPKEPPPCTASRSSSTVTATFSFPSATAR